MTDEQRKPYRQWIEDQMTLVAQYIHRQEQSPEHAVLPKAVTHAIMQCLNALDTQHESREHLHKLIDHYVQASAQMADRIIQLEIDNNKLKTKRRKR